MKSIYQEERQRSKRLRQQIKDLILKKITTGMKPYWFISFHYTDNKTNEDSEWDFNLLNKEFTDLLDINFDLEGTGFDPKELEDFFTFDKEEEAQKVKSEKHCPNCGTKIK